LNVDLTLTGPDVKHRVGATVVMGGVPLMMAGISLWLLTAYWREELTIHGERVTFRGIVRRRDVDLREVTRALWRTGHGGGSVVHRTETARLSIHLANYEDEGRDQLVRHLRSVLDPQIQTGWSLFAYKIAFRQPRSIRTKPGPDEILLGRGRWDRYFMPALVVASLAGVVSWRITDELRYLAAPLPFLALWALMRATTPAAGMVVQKLVDPDTVRILWFLHLWLAVAIAGLMAHKVFRPRPADPDAFMIVGALVWFGVLLFEGGRVDRRRTLRDREAADLAAKARGEAPADPWQAD
jgi:hypothetical protein